MLMSNPSVLVLTSTFPRWRRDTTPAFVEELSRGLAGNWHLTVLAPHAPGARKQERSGKIAIRRFAYFKPESIQRLCYKGGILPNLKASLLAKIQLPFLILAEFLVSLSLARKENVSLIHAHWLLPQGIVGSWLKRLLGVPLLVTIHGSDLFPLNNMLYRTAQSTVVKTADHITVNSEATKKELLSRFPWAAGKVSVVPMGIDTDLFRPSRERRNPNTLLFVGRLSEQKGLQYLLQAMPSIISAFPRARLEIVGEGPYREALVRLVESLELSGHVEFLGSLPHAALPSKYRKAAVVVQPSLSGKSGTEAFGLTIVESMACGCPVISTRVGGIPSLISHGKTGILVNEKNPRALGRAVNDLLGHGRKAQKLGKSAASSVKRRYDWRVIHQEFLKIYEAVAR